MSTEDQTDASGFQPSYDGKQKTLDHAGAIYSTFAEDMAPYVAEFIGTFLLTTTFLCNYSASSSPMWNITSNAFMNMILVYSFLHVSGANFNPSVTIALMLAGRKKPAVAARFCAVQILAAVAAGITRTQFAMGTMGQINIGPNPGYSWYSLGCTEIVYTALVSFVYLNCAASVKNNPSDDQNGFVGLAIGFCFISGGFASATICHSVMNSAIAIGIEVVDSKDGISGTGVWYFMLDIFGAFIGAGLYRIVRPEEFVDDTELADVQESESSIATQRVGVRVSAEFIGTFYVVLTKALNHMDDSANNPEAFSVGATLAAMNYALRDVSGGYFNPAVTASVWISRWGRLPDDYLPTATVVFSVITQVFAASVATGVAAIINGHTKISVRQDNGAYSTGSIVFCETCFTFAVCYVVLTTSTGVYPSSAQSKQNNIAGIAYGMCHSVGGFAIGNISGAILNPAAVIGFSGVSALQRFDFKSTEFGYVLYEMMGGILAAVVFLVTHARLYGGGDDDKGTEKRSLAHASA